MAGRYRDNGEGTISRHKDGRWVARYYIRAAGGLKRKAIHAGSRSEAATLLALAERDGRGPITVDPSKLAFERDLEAAGIPRDVRFHDLRHTAATLMLKKRIPVNVVAQVLGYSDPAMTSRRYAHAMPDMQEIAAEAMERCAF